MKIFRIKQFYYITIFLNIFIFSSCKHTEKKESTHVIIKMPENYSSIPTEIKALKNWWQTFPFENLNDLIKSVLSNNLSLKEAKAKLEQVKALSLKTSSPLYPSLNFSSKASNTEINNKLSKNISTEEYTVGFTASYEIDIWKKLNSLSDAALLDVKASEKDLETVYQSLAAKTTELFIKVIGEQNIQNKLKEQIALNENLLKNAEIRLLNSQSNMVEYLKAEQVLSNVKSQLPLSIQKEKIFKSEINLLKGNIPLSDISIPITDLKSFPPFPDIGIPIDLINNRPDVQSAFIQFEAEMKRLYSAKTNRYPSIKIDASFFYTAGKIIDVFDNWISSLIASFLAPIIDGKLKKSEIIRLKAVTEQKIASYKNTALTALKEVEAAIIQEKSQLLYLTELKSQVDYLKNAFEVSLSRYRNGLNDYLTVAGLLQNLQNLEISLIRGEVELWTYRISLHKALGGTWVNKLNDEILLNKD